jgi:hypothetical protein
MHTSDMVRMKRRLAKQATQAAKQANERDFTFRILDLVDVPRSWGIIQTRRGSDWDSAERKLKIAINRALGRSNILTPVRLKQVSVR